MTLGERNALIEECAKRADAVAVDGNTASEWDSAAKAAAAYIRELNQPPKEELKARKADAWVVLERTKDKGALTVLEASAKLLAEFVRDLPEPTE